MKTPTPKDTEGEKDVKEQHVEHKIDEEQLQALFQGKKLVINYQGLPRITLYPPRYGVFMTYEKFAEMEKRVYARAFEELTDFLRKIRESDSMSAPTKEDTLK